MKHRCRSARRECRSETQAPKNEQLKQRGTARPNADLRRRLPLLSFRRRLTARVIASISGKNVCARQVKFGYVLPGLRKH
jgi:hypothetical protein